MNNAFRFDRTLYVLIGLVLLGQLMLAGCWQSVDSQTSTEGQVELQEQPLPSDDADDVVSPMEETTSTTSEADTTSGASTTPPTTTTTSGSVSEETTPSVQAEEEETPAPESVYVDGTYTSSASYETPVGSESIQVSLTVKGDVVTGLTVTPMAKDPTSQNYQALFISGINAQVVGKSLASLSGFGPVNGSSLTPIGFQAAVASIKGQAASL